jgi:hypothetical protein
MNSAKKARLEAAGWKVGTAEEFLGLSKVEAAIVEAKLALARKLKERRLRTRLTQTVLARRIGSSQSRVAKVEAGDPSVSFDLLIKALFATGASRRQLGQAIASRKLKMA